MKLRLSLGLLLLCAPPALSQDGNLALGAGTLLCNQINPVGLTDEAASSAFANWAAGFLSGMNIQGALDNRPQVDLLAVAANKPLLIGRVMAYCDKNPETTVLWALVSMMNEERLKQ